MCWTMPFFLSWSLKKHYFNQICLLTTVSGNIYHSRKVCFHVKVIIHINLYHVKTIQDLNSKNQNCAEDTSLSSKKQKTLLVFVNLFLFSHAREWGSEKRSIWLCRYSLLWVATRQISTWNMKMATTGKLAAFYKLSVHAEGILRFGFQNPEIFNFPDTWWEGTRSNSK